MKESILKGVFVAAIASAAAHFRKLVPRVGVMGIVKKVVYLFLLFCYALCKN